MPCPLKGCSCAAVESSCLLIQMCRAVVREAGVGVLLYTTGSSVAAAAAAAVAVAVAVAAAVGV